MCAMHFRRTYRRQYLRTAIAAQQQHVVEKCEAQNVYIFVAAEPRFLVALFRHIVHTAVEV